jgi:murein DD-endopeptidase MepM/ murein hydrolase activator NlpD
VAAVAGRGIAPVLRAAGLELESLDPAAVDWSLATLGSFSAVVLENVPASSIGRSGLETLAAWVHTGAGGLLVTGGRSSYATGGYYRSALDPLLPVSMELRREHRKLALAMVIAMDRSGSMMADAGGGRTKMELADLAAAEVVSMLSPMDELGVLAVDSSAHMVVGLNRLVEPDVIRDRVLSIGSAGGGIFIFEALSTSAAMLAEAEAGTRHILLLADAADSEEPGAYKELLRHAAEAGITVSVIGLGTPTDKDADLLRDIARRGNGQVYFTSDATELPRLFAQDTFIVSRGTFIEAETPLRSTAALPSLLGLPLPDPSPVDGYNLCYARPGARVAIRTADDQEAPIAAAWNVEAGRVVCLTAEAAGPLTGRLAEWPHTSELLSGLTRWAMGAADTLTDEAVPTQELEGGVLRLRLHLDPSEPASMPEGPVVARIAHAGARMPTIETHELHWLAVDQLGLDVRLDDERPVLATIDAGSLGRASLPATRPLYPSELAPPADGRAGAADTSDRAALERLARAGRGTLRQRPETVWTDLPREPARRELAPWLYLLAAAILLAEVAQRRAGLPEAAVRVASRTVRHTIRRTIRRMLGRTTRAPAQAQGAAPRDRRTRPEPTRSPAPASRTAAPEVDAPETGPPPGERPAAGEPRPVPPPAGPGVLDAIDAVRRRRRGPGRRRTPPVWLVLALLPVLASALACGSNEQAPASCRPDGWPLPAGTGRIVSSFGDRRGTRRHRGVDIRAGRGTPVLATAAGLVVAAGRGRGGYGHMVAIDHGQGWQTRYAHLASVEVTAADRVEPGDVVGTVGSSGNARSSHLHYEVRRYGTALDPAPFLGSRETRGSTAAARGDEP